MKITVLTLFPEMFGPVTTQSILGRANEASLLDVDLVNIRDYTLDKHGRTDDTPFGGGAGMVFTPEPCFRALEAAGVSPGTSRRCIYPSPRGKKLDRKLIEEYAKEEELVILCGHYEGIDERILEAYHMEEVSVGDYILTGGELPAMILIDAVARFLPDVLGNKDANLEESIYSGLLEYPQYTKPRMYRGLEVPEVLLSGDHERIRLWRLEQSLRLTKEKRPDLFEAFCKRYEPALTSRKIPVEYDGLSRKELKLLQEVSK